MNQIRNRGENRLAKGAGQIFLYLLVGGGTALLEILVFSVLLRVFGTNLVVANIVAVCIATATNFILNGTVTFRSSGNIIRSIVLYILLFLFNMAFSTATISLLSKFGVTEEIAKVCTMICIVIWNYLLYKKVVFR